MSSASSLQQISENINSSKQFLDEKQTFKANDFINLVETTNRYQGQLKECLIADSSISPQNIKILKNEDNSNLQDASNQIKIIQQRVFPPLLRLGPDILKTILKTSGQHLPEVCMAFNQETENMKRDCWRTLCKIAPTNPVLSNYIKILGAEKQQLKTLHYKMVENLKIVNPKSFEVIAAKRYSIVEPSLYVEIANEIDNIQAQDLLRTQPQIAISIPEVAGLSLKQLRFFLNNPENLEKIQKVHTLDLTGLRLISLPPEICLFNHLEMLFLVNNQIVALPEDFNPSKLKHLHLENNPISFLPECFNPANLEWLNLDGSRISFLPTRFNPPKLQFLSLQNTQIKALPKDFNPKTLRWLYLDNAPIDALPDGFNPQNLIILDLFHTGLVSLPEGFNPDKLELLNLQYTKIQKLPLKFNPPNLLELSLQHTPLEALPIDFNPPKLQSLNLQHTNIKELPAGFMPPNLQKLFLLYSPLHSSINAYRPCLSTKLAQSEIWRLLLNP